MPKLTVLGREWPPFQAETFLGEEEPTAAKNSPSDIFVSVNSQCRGFSTICARLDFDKIFKDGKRFFRDGLSFCAIKTPTPGFRFAVSVSKHFGKAVYRNKLRRRVKEVIRTSAFLPASAMVVISAKRPCESYSFASVKSACEWAFAKIQKMPPAVCAVK